MARELTHAPPQDALDAAVDRVVDLRRSLAGSGLGEEDHDEGGENPAERRTPAGRSGRRGSMT